MRPPAPLLLLATLCPALSAQQALFLRNHQLVGLPAPTTRQALDQLFAGPPPGLTTAIPPDTRLLAQHADGPELTLTVSRQLLLPGPGHTLEHAIEQIDKTALADGSFTSVRLLVRDSQGRDRTLRELLGEDHPAALAPPPPPRLGPNGIAGALSGKRIAVSPGHGYYWSATLNAWTTQRGAIDGLTEDFHTNEICMDWLMPYLENLGALTFSCRERSRQPSERYGDNDPGAGTYAETGAWATGAANGYNLKTYRYATTTATVTATATWDVPLPQDGIHPVYVFFAAGTNRVPDARFTVHHSGGATPVLVDQTRTDRCWVWLGDFAFTAAAGARVVLANQSAQAGKVVIADAVRIGAGLGTSGKPKWQECARVWTQFAGAPAAVWNRGTGSDNGDDVTTRPAFAEWQGADAFVSLHTNAGGGAGTETFIYSGGATAGSAQLQSAVNNQIVADLRAEYDPAWVNRGLKSANFGEVRVLGTMPGILCELAFHDTIGSADHRALHDPRFRRIAARAFARGVLRYFQPNAPFPPEPPAALRVTQDGARGLRVAWDGVAGASAYSIETSPDGRGFVEAAQTPATSWSTGPLAHGSLRSFRVRALNPTGRSLTSEVLCAGTDHRGRAALLLVQGFDRSDRYVKEPENTFDYLRLHGDAIRRANLFSLGFDAASNEAVALGRVPLAAYRAVDWALGEESTQHETFSATEQSLVASYLQQGGRLLVSGAELAWDLGTLGSPSDRAFLQTLGLAWGVDDAGTYGFQAGLGVLQGLPAGSFDNGSAGTYDVGTPDELVPFDARSTVCLRYATGVHAAGVAKIDGAARVLALGFPFETVTSPALRADLMARALRFLLAPEELAIAPAAPLGQVTPLTLTLPAEANAPYLLFAALGPGTLALPGGGILPLQYDGVFELSITPNNGVFGGFSGALDASGRASAAFAVPNLPFLAGIPLWFSGLTLQAPGVPIEKHVLPWVRTTVQ